MELKVEAIRDVLLYLEKAITIERSQYGFLTNSIGWYELYQCAELRAKHSEADIQYTIFALWDAGLIRCDPPTKGNNGDIILLSIRDISWNGHELLNNIRPQRLWDSIKTTAKKVGISSVKGIVTLAGAAIQGIASNPDILRVILSGAGIES